DPSPPRAREVLHAVLGRREERGDEQRVRAFLQAPQAEAPVGPGEVVGVFPSPRVLSRLLAEGHHRDPGYGPTRGIDDPHRDREAEADPDPHALARLALLDTYFGASFGRASECTIRPEHVAARREVREAEAPAVVAARQSVELVEHVPIQLPGEACVVRA